MKKQQHEETEKSNDLRLWTYADAVRLVPYLRSVVRSLREHWLEMQQVERELQRIDARHGRPDRQAMILRQTVEVEVEHASERFEETLNELAALDGYCLDPAMGLALIPFRQGDDLAWFVFDLFEPQGLKEWRYHADPLATRRSLADHSDPSMVDAVFSQRLGFGKGAQWRNGRFVE